MKRLDLIRHLERNGCVLLREGRSHSVFINRATRKSSTMPRHREINEFLARKNVPRSRSFRALRLGHRQQRTLIREEQEYCRVSWIAHT